MIGPNELLRRLQQRSDVHEDEVQAFLASRDGSVRRAALVGLIRTHFRAAAEYLNELSKMDDDRNPGMLDLLERVSVAGEYEVPLIAAHVRIGVARAAQGNVEEALRCLQHAVNLAGNVGQRRDERSRSALRYLHDRDIDEALDCLARRFPSPSLGRERRTGKIALVVSAIIDDNAPSMVALTYARELRKRGFDVRILSTEYGNSQGSRILRRFYDEGIPVALLGKGTYAQRVLEALHWFEQEKIHLGLWLITPMDLVAKMLGCISCAPVQVFTSIAYEPHVGRYDLVVNNVSPEQERRTLWSGKSRYVPSFVAIADDIDKAAPFDVEAIGIPGGSNVIGTYCRMEKCLPLPYLDGVGRILITVPSAHLVLAGPGTQADLSTIMQRFGELGVANRVHYLGPRQEAIPALLRSTDLYCDTYPWPGGQSLLEAMWAGCAVVSWHSVTDDILDPTSAGPTSATAEAFLPDHTMLAAPGDATTFAELGAAVLKDDRRRAELGARNEEHARRMYSTERSFDLLAEMLHRLISGESE